MIIMPAPVVRGHLNARTKQACCTASSCTPPDWGKGRSGVRQSAGGHDPVDRVVQDGGARREIQAHEALRVRREGRPSFRASAGLRQQERVNVRVARVRAEVQPRSPTAHREAETAKAHRG